MACNRSALAEMGHQSIPQNAGDLSDLPAVISSDPCPARKGPGKSFARARSAFSDAGRDCAGPGPGGERLAKQKNVRTTGASAAAGAGAHRGIRFLVGLEK